MPNTYRDIVVEATFEEQRRQANMDAKGNPENPADFEHPVKPAGMTELEWNEYQAWRVEEDAAYEWERAGNTRRMEIAGEYSPRF